MKILILASHYPPLNITSSNRISAFVKYMSEAGHEITVITRYYDEKQCSRSDLNIADYPPSGFQEDYIRKNNVFYTNYAVQCVELRIFQWLPPGIKGIYNLYHIDVFHYGWIQYITQVYTNELSGIAFDFIIASGPPYITWEAARQLSNKSGTPWIADMRDSFITEEDSFYHAFLKGIFFKNLLLTARAILFVSEGMKSYVGKNIPALSKKPNALIYNGIALPDSEGYSPGDLPAIELFRQIKATHNLTFLYTGSLYPKRNIDAFIQYITRFNTENKKSLKIVLVCAGLQDEFQRRYKNSANSSDLLFLPKVRYDSSIYLQSNADALILPLWKNGYTEFSGKVFEYLYSENICWVHPEPQNDLKTLLAASPNIYYLKNYNDFCGFVQNMLSGQIVRKVMANKELLLRKHQVNKLLYFLTDLKSHV